MTFKKIFSSITIREWRLVWIVAAVVIVLTTAPIIYGWWKTGTDQEFTAIHFVSHEDWPVYYSFIEQGRAGRLFFYDLFSPIDHWPNFRPEWLVVGWIAWLFDIKAWVALHLARILLIPIFFVIAYMLIAYFFSEKKWRQVTLLFLAFSSGMGIVLIHRLLLNPYDSSRGLFQWPMDVWVPDANTFYTLHTSPHFIAATILLMLIFLATLLFTETKKQYYGLVAGLSGLALFTFHPFQVIKVYLILGLFFLGQWIYRRKIDWRDVGFGALFFIINVPAIVYHLVLMRFDWLTQQRVIQNINPTTPLGITILGFGGLLLCSAVALWLLATKKIKCTTPLFFAGVWLVVQWMCLYAPINYQRRTVLGIHIVLVLLTVTALRFFFVQFQRSIKKNIGAVMMVGFLIFLPSTFFVIAADMIVFSQERNLAYLHDDEIAAFQWLRTHTAEDAIIFASPKTSLLLPTYSLRRVYAGHAVESPLYYERKNDAEKIFSNQLDYQQEYDFFRRHGIGFVYYGPREREIEFFRNDDKIYLQKTFENNHVTIFQVL